jgi:hypothetical protein
MTVLNAKHGEREWQENSFEIRDGIEGQKENINCEPRSEAEQSFVGKQAHLEGSIIIIRLDGSIGLLHTILL